MRTLKLTKDSQKNILESLLKRSPNNYTEYESTVNEIINNVNCLLYTSPSPRDGLLSRMPSSA